MKVFMTMMMILILLTGCSAVKQRSIANDIVDMSDRVEQVCNTVSLFSAVDVAAPAVEQCERAIKIIDTEEYAILYDVANCARKNDLDSEEMKLCILKIKGWKTVAKKLLE